MNYNQLRLAPEQIIALSIDDSYHSRWQLITSHLISVISKCIFKVTPPPSSNVAEIALLGYSVMLVHNGTMLSVKVRLRRN